MNQSSTSNNDSSSPHLTVHDLLQYGARHGQRSLPSLELASILLGMLTTALILTVYVEIRPVFHSSTERVRRLLGRLSILVVLYALFLCFWIMSVKNTSKLFTGAWFPDHSADVDLSGDSFPFGPLLLECALFGSFSALVIASVYIFAQNNLRSRPQQAMLSAALLLYAISLAHLAIEAQYVARFSMLPATELEVTTTTAEQAAPQALTLANVVLSDAIVLWRMCTLCEQRAGARILAAVLLTSTVVFSVLNLIQGLSNFAISFTVPVLSLVTNMTSTLFVGWRIWRYRRDVSVHLAKLSRHSVAEKVMVLLVESGFIYCIAWIVYCSSHMRIAASEAPANNRRAVLVLSIASYLNRLISQLAGIYPTVVVVLVALEQSFLEEALSESKLSAFVVAHPGTNPHTERTISLQSASLSDTSVMGAAAVSRHSERSLDTRHGEKSGDSDTRSPFHAAASV